MQAQLALQQAMLEQFQKMRSKNPAFSLRAYAQRLDMNSGALSAIMNGRRNVSVRYVRKLVQRMALAPEEAAKINELLEFGELLKVPTPQSRTALQLKSDQFHMISDGLHYSLLCLFETSDFRSDVTWMAKRLEVTPAQVRQALGRLLRLKLVAKLGARWSLTGAKLTTSDGIPDPAIRNFHEERLSEAKNKLLTVPVTERDFVASTMAIQRSQLPLARKLIREFKRKLEMVLEKSPQDEVYRVCIQLFPVTDLTGRNEAGRAQPILLQILLLLSSIAFSLRATVAVAGHDVLNGGDSLAMVIEKSAQDLSQRWAALTPSCAAQMPTTAETFEHLVQTAQIETTDVPLSLVENGTRVFKEAINDPQKKWIQFNRESFEKSALKDTLIVHEFLGLAGVPDFQYRESSKAITLLNSPVCRPTGSHFEPGGGIFPRGLTPAFALVDQRGVVYFSDAQTAALYRFDLKTNHVLPALLLRSVPQSGVYAEALDRIYLSDGEKQISRIDLHTAAEPNAEINFVVSSDSGSEMVVLGRHLFIFPKTQNWEHDYVYDENAKLIQDIDMQEPGESHVPAANGQSIYFISGFSPANLERVIIGGGKIAKTIDSASARDYALAPPLMTSPRYLLIGSGALFDVTDLHYVASLPHAVIAGHWLGGRLTTARSEATGFSLSRWNLEMTEETKQVFAGQFHQLLVFAQQSVLIWQTNEDELKISTINDDLLGSLP
jgi:uncharacterized protein (TIGR02147 family)